MILRSFRTARHYTRVHPGPNWAPYGVPDSNEKWVLGHRSKNKTSKSLWSICIVLLCDSQFFYVLIHIFEFNSHRYIFPVIFSNPFKHTCKFYSHSSLWQWNLQAVRKVYVYIWLSTEKLLFPKCFFYTTQDIPSFWHMLFSLPHFTDLQFLILFGDPNKEEKEKLERKPVLLEKKNLAVHIFLHSIHLARHHFWRKLFIIIRWKLWFSKCRAQKILELK